MSAQGSPDWLAKRRGGIGASELAVILGLDPYRGEYELALEKRGLSEPTAQTWPMTWGHYVQRMARDIYHELTGDKCRNVHVSHNDPRWPHVFVSPDLRVVGKPRLVECKWTSKRLAEPLRHWDIQVQAQMRVAHVESVDILKISGYEEPVLWRREPEPWIDELLDTAEAWYVKFVLGDEMPPMDGSRAASRYLDAMSGEDVMRASDEQDALVARLGALRTAEAQAKAEADIVVNRVKESMAGSYRLEGRGYSITWRPTKPRQSVDWQAVAAELAAPPEVIDRHTTTAEGTRPFRVTFEREETP